MKHILIINILLLLGHPQGSKMKYDYIETNLVHKRISFQSMITIITPNQDTIYKYYYYNIDSSFNVTKLNSFDFKYIEPINKNNHFIENTLEIKFNNPVTSWWKTIYDNEYTDSLSVKLLNITDTTINDISISKCYIYDVKYNKELKGEDFMDFILFFDFERRIIVRKEYYQNNVLTGYLEILKETKVDDCFK